MCYVGVVVVVITADTVWLRLVTQLLDRCREVYYTKETKTLDAYRLVLS